MTTNYGNINELRIDTNIRMKCNTLNGSVARSDKRKTASDNKHQAPGTKSQIQNGFEF